MQTSTRATAVLQGVAMLRAIREAQGLTNANIGASLGVSREVINNILTGHNCPTRNLKLKIARVYGVPVEAWQIVAK